MYLAIHSSLEQMTFHRTNFWRIITNHIYGTFGLWSLSFDRIRNNRVCVIDTQGVKFAMWKLNSCSKKCLICDSWVFFSKWKVCDSNSRKVELLSLTSQNVKCHYLSWMINNKWQFLFSMSSSTNSRFFS